MGNDQSRSTPAGGGNQPVDYYELLQVSEEATSDEIKRSYRRLALSTHPDKCPPNRVEEATRMFADLQQAYEILMDPNERAFYDNHRNLPDLTNDNDLYDHVRSGEPKAATRPSWEPGVRLEQLLRFFDPKLARKMDDSKDGFFSVYRSLFALLASDEDSHATASSLRWEYPSFGDSQSSYAPPPGMARSARDAQTWVKDFYGVWSEFSTEKRFEWVKRWDAERGEDRSMRRLMERENRKTRDEYRKDYNDTVKQLVRFLQVRDPRYKAWQAEVTRCRAERQSRTAAQTVHKVPSTPLPNDFEVQDWQRLDNLDLSSEEDEGIPETLECVACGKTFLTEASWSNHERSKKHRQAVHSLRKAMQADADDLDLVSAEPTVATLDSASPDGETQVQVTTSELDHSGLAPSSGNETTDDLHDSRRGVKTPTSTPSTDSWHPDHPATDPTSDDSLCTPAPTLSSISEHRDGHDAAPAAGVGPSLPGPSPSSTLKRPMDPTTEGETSIRPSTLHSATGRPRLASQGDGNHITPDATFDDIKGTSRSSRSSRRGNKKKIPPHQPTNPHDREPIPDDKQIDEAVNAILTKREKLRDKWGSSWESALATIRSKLRNPVDILCLGLGKCYSDRTAQIQLALLLLLVKDLDAVAVSSYDPVWEDADKKVLRLVGVVVLEENLTGAHKLETDKSYLLYLPHCPKVLYQQILQNNYSPLLCHAVILGNQLSDYADSAAIHNETRWDQQGFVKAKKKRPGRNLPRGRVAKDGVLERLVPHLASLPLSQMSDTHLPGFARAFLSLSFQWLPEDKTDTVDWSTPLPPIDMDADSHEAI